MKHTAQIAALMMLLAMFSSTALADQHGKDNKEGDLATAESSVDSANDPDDGTGTDHKMPLEEELAPKSGVDSANDSEDGTGPEPEMQPEGELAPKSGVDSANDAED